MPVFSTDYIIVKEARHEPRRADDDWSLSKFPASFTTQSLEEKSPEPGGRLLKEEQQHNKVDRKKQIGDT